MEGLVARVITLGGGGRFVGSPSSWSSEPYPGAEDVARHGTAAQGRNGAR